jgi:hypothetical protein
VSRVFRLYPLVLLGLVIALASRGRARTAGAALAPATGRPPEVFPWTARRGRRGASLRPASVNVEPGGFGGIESQLGTNGSTGFAAVNDLAFS